MQIKCNVKILRSHFVNGTIQRHSFNIVFTDPTNTALPDTPCRAKAISSVHAPLTSEPNRADDGLHCRPSSALRGHAH